MMRYIVIFMLLAVPALANDLPARPLFKPSGSAPMVNAPLPIAMPSAISGTSSNGIGSFMYFAPDKWSFWWQGQRVTPDELPDGISDVDVTPNAIRFTQHGEAHEFLFGKFN